MLDEAVRVLKKKSQILVSAYKPYMYQIPPSGIWGIYIKGWVESKVKDFSAIVEFLKNKGFKKIEFFETPDLYWCILAERS